MIGLFDFAAVMAGMFVASKVKSAEGYLLAAFFEVLGKYINVMVSVLQVRIG